VRRLPVFGAVGGHLKRERYCLDGSSILWGNSIVSRGGAEEKKSAFFKESSNLINDPEVED
jgi:hypothetical protein